MATIRLLRRLLVLLLAALVLLAVARRDVVVAQVRAVAVLAGLLDVPVLAPVVRALTGEPVASDVRLAGIETTMVVPAGDGPWPAVLFATGADPAGRDSSRVLDLADGLARAGFVVFVPDLPGLRDARVDGRVADAAVDVVLAAGRQRAVRDGRVALASVSAGASIALVAAADPRMQGNVTTVAAIAPFADLRNMLMLAATGSHRDADGRTRRYDADPYMRESLERSMRAIAGDSRLAQLYVTSLLAADVETFDARYELAPARVRDTVRELSPITHAARLDLPVHVASGPHDRYFPLSESESIVAAAPDARLTVTPILDHAIPEPSLGGIGDLAAFDAWMVRVLRDAASED